MRDTRWGRGEGIIDLSGKSSDIDTPKQATDEENEETPGGAGERKLA